MSPAKITSIRREPSDAMLRQLGKHVDPHFDFNTPQGRELIRMIASECLDRRQTMRDIELRASAMMKQIDGAMQATPCLR